MIGVQCFTELGIPFWGSDSYNKDRHIFGVPIYGNYHVGQTSGSLGAVEGPKP